MAARSSGCRKGGRRRAQANSPAGFKVIASGLCQCVLDEQAGREDAAAERVRLEKLFLSLA